MPLQAGDAVYDLLHRLGHSDALINSASVGGKFAGTNPVFTPERAYTAQELAAIEQEFASEKQNRP